jgi:hypothetical protein
MRFAIFVGLCLVAEAIAFSAGDGLTDFRYIYINIAGTILAVMDMCEFIKKMKSK